MNIYSIYDRKVEAFMRPFFMVKDGQAVRAFSDMVNEPGHELNKHPEDYRLELVGQWDDQRGEVTPLSRPVCTAMDVLKKESEVEGQLSLITEDKKAVARA